MCELNAHSPNDQGKWHSLQEHLQMVAGLCQQFAAKFGSESVARDVALWHDIGKAIPEFQEYLLLCHEKPNQKHRGPDHKGAGAVFALKRLEPLAFLIAGHHGGLQNSDDLRVWLTQRAEKWTDSSIEQLIQVLDLAGTHKETLAPPLHIKTPLQAELFLRLLFSCLVDADFLDTEYHFSPDKSTLRKNAIRIDELWHAFEYSQQELSCKGSGLLHDVRNTIYRECLAAAPLEPGFFRLTVPTGGGKTRSGMAFALRHAMKHGKDRVVVAIPYTSIIEQTAGIYRDIFGSSAVLEHHSAASVPDDEDYVDDGTSWVRLAAENWDVPIVVTTTVQLFESLFANKTSRCRKLHNIVNSVIILDEVQTLPTKLLTPILDVLNELVANYRVSVVLCTATQPAVDDVPHFAGIKGIREIVSEPTRWFSILKRVNYCWDRTQKWTWDRVAKEMQNTEQCLAIVNTKNDAFALLDALADANTLHLSTNICGAHRRAVLKDVRTRLAEKKPCRLVSTQVVEAGVDVDFPEVLRSIGPLDRIVQAAGRCNREGTLTAGRMIVFDPAEGKLPPGDYSTGTATALSLMQQDSFDFHDPKVFRIYFRMLYQAVNLDAKGIQPLRERLQFKETAERFSMIDDDSVSVVVHYRGPDGSDGEVDRLIERLAKGWHGSPMAIVRSLQPFMVNLRRRAFSQAEKDGLVRQVMPGVYEWLGKYDAVCGIVFGNIDPDNLVV